MISFHAPTCVKAVERSPEVLHAKRMSRRLLGAVMLLLLVATLGPAAGAAGSQMRQCLRLGCKQQREACRKAFKHQARDARRACSDHGGKARKECKQHEKRTWRLNRKKCNAARKACKACCKQGRSGCAVRVLGDGVCGGVTVAREECDGGDDAGCPGRCRGDCRCPSPTTTLDGNYAIIAADPLAQVAREYAQYRIDTGYAAQLFVVSDLVNAPYAVEHLVPAVHELLQGAHRQLPEGETLYLALLGDAPGIQEHNTGLIPAVPCENDFGPGGCHTDNAYGDLDGDGLPEVAVGRVPARTPQQVRDYLDKLRTHESRYTTGLWNRRITVYAEQGGFGDTIDALLEMLVMSGLKAVDHAFDTIGVYANPASRYYYTPFSNKVIELFNDGNLMTVYFGHGSSGWTYGLPIGAVPEIHCDERFPISFFFACNNGSYRGRGDSIAEALIWNPHGSIIVFAASELSGPYGNAVLSYEIQRAIMDARLPTIGEAILSAKWQVMENSDAFRQLTEHLAVVSGMTVAERETSRFQHLNLYNLLGDPAVALQYPRSVIEFGSGVSGSLPDGLLHVSGTAPGVGDGTAWVTLETERDVVLHNLIPVDPGDPDADAVRTNWELAVDKIVVGETVAVEGGAFTADLRFPADLPAGDYYVKVYAHDGTSDSFGYARLRRN